ncbi:MAG TPA: DUF4175 family protein [Puia sp.]|uniref:DUF4175 family protein n=1 Tax=Puia sp. TaxID=2045100 RepID=UPI002CA169D9|nr:DUF4175 family protein [Puia sp.]HVU95152.1 DUF4175 family protein [Puia sp.]
MGAKKLRSICWRWRAGGILFCLLVALAATVAVVEVGWSDFKWPLWAVLPVFAGSFGGALLLFPTWRIRLADVVSYLDRRLPELEDSCGLLLRRPEDLGRLERLQAARVEERLLSAKLPRPMLRRLLLGIGSVGIGIFAGMAFLVVGDHFGPGKIRDRWPLPDMPAVGVRAVQVRITPPAYTGRVVRRQDNFSLEAEQGAQVNWEVVTKGVADTVAFVFNDTAVKVLRREDSVRWTFSEVAQQPGFYQVRVGGQLSSLYRFDVVKDEPPKVRIVRPKPYSMIDYGESMRIPLRVELTDDYGITGSSVFAMVSSGKGEAVKFREQELRWDRGFPGGRDYMLNRVLDLPALGLKPGDELYFYCTVLDNHGQEARSDMYIVALADTAQLMSLEGMTIPTDVKPELFRSERQIIIETEQLLKVKDTIALRAFRDKSNDLGIDQKLLRLRYGKFLGEEAEEGGARSDTTDFGTFGDAARILDVYSDKHDNAEDATFLEPAVKAQLRATLSEMWKAELQFRVNKPRDALPFCYRALRLLKDLQQQSRVYVAKTGVRLTPLNPDKRLTGELGAIEAPVQRLGRIDELPEEEVLRMGLAVLEGMRVGMRLGERDRMVLGRVERRLGKEAAAKPGRFLAGYEGMKRLSNEEEMVAAEKAIGMLLPVAEQRPGLRNVAADGGLGRLYFHFIK